MTLGSSQDAAGSEYLAAWLLSKSPIRLCTRAPTLYQQAPPKAKTLPQLVSENWHSRGFVQTEAAAESERMAAKPVQERKGGAGESGAAWE